MISLYFLTISLVYSLFLNALFFYKKHIETRETKLYSYMLIINLAELILELSCVMTIRFLGTESIITYIVNRLFLASLLTFLYLFAIYVLEIIFGNNVASKEGKISEIVTTIICIVSVISIFVAPLHIYSANNLTYSYGLSTEIVYYVSLLCTILTVASMIKNFKNLKQKKFLSLFVFIFGGIATAMIQMFNPGLTITTSMEAFLMLVMYHTIENPDVAMIEQLNIARDQAEKANNAKSDFLSSMSHEIRTPLNAIVGFSQALSEEELPLQAKEEVKDIMMASETLLDIVNGILDISKIEANKLEIVNTEYSFNSVLEELVSLTKARLGEKPLDFRYSFSPDIPKYMYGDKVRVKQVILNLLTNAVKYTHEGWIEFKVSCVNKGNICRLIISVQDTGIGIKEDSINKLFNRFERLDIEKNNTIEGTGLGLAITKKLIELMGGQIVVQSVYGEGSKFTLAIDQRIVTNPTNPNLEKTQAIDLSAVKNIDLTNRRILVVDDNKINLKVASRLLQDYHCIIDTLESGIECVEKIKMGASYDLILMDDMMPKQGGVETLHKLKEIEGYNIPTVALTANAISGMKEKYLSEGFDDYLSKPIDKTELNRVLNKFIK